MATKTANTTQGTVPTGAKPVLPREGGSTNPDVLAELRRFHLAGLAGKETAPATGTSPAVLHALLASEEVRVDYPLFLSPWSREEPERLALPLADLLKRAAPQDDAARVLRDNLPRLERQVRMDLAAGSEPTNAVEALRQAGTTLVAELKLGNAENEQLVKGLETLIASVPAEGTLLPFSAVSPFHLLHLAAEARLTPARHAFADEVSMLAEKVRGVLEVDRSKGPEGSQEKAVTGAMGGVGSQFIKGDALSGVLSSRRGGAGLPAARRDRLELTLEQLDGYIEASAHVSPTLIAPPELRLALSGWNVVPSADPCRAAAERFDEAATDVAEVLRAVHMARLELAERYDPSRHDPWLAQLDWEVFSREELHLIPTIVAVVPAALVAGDGLLSLSRLLLSGRPVQILLLGHPAESPGAEADDALSGYRFEPGYLGISHREAVVQQTTIARPLHMLEGFTKGLHAAHTALHVVAMADGDRGATSADPWLFLTAALEGRAHPVFHYDPEAGETWSRRMAFHENPANDDDWPVHELTVKKEDGGEETMLLRFTFADFALLDPAYRDHFRVVPVGVAAEDLMPLHEVLRLPAETAAQKIPMIWAIGPDGRLTRLAVSRRLALATRDRLGYWRTLQELAGVRNAYVQEAADRVREEYERKAIEDRERLSAEHARELEEVRRRAAEEAVNRMTAALLEIDVAAFAAPAAGLDGLRGRSVDEVAATLLGLVESAQLEQEVAAGDVPPTGAQVEEMTRDLLDLIDPSSLESNS
jgi:hypothetical protein